VAAGAFVDTRHQFAGLFSLYEWVTGIVVVLVFLITLFALVRYRRRDDAYPRGRTEAKVAESVYALVLAGIAAVLIAATFRTEDRVDPVRANPGLRIEITAFQWQWRFAYPATGKVVTGTTHRPATLVVPVDTLIRFSGTSRDVIHSFWIPDLRFKRDEFPDRTTHFDLVFDRLGTLRGHCAEFCGLKHTDMNFDVRVVGADEFRRWAAAP
jgi:cytochrome c oxidase subunit 2